MREKFNFVPAFFVKCKQETFDPAQLPQMLQETKQQIREKSCDPRECLRMDISCAVFDFVVSCFF